MTAGKQIDMRDSYVLCAHIVSERHEFEMIK